MSVYKGAALLEADPTSNYERAVRDFAQEMTSAGRLVFAFTAKGSPVYLLLKDVPNIRFFTLSETSYPKPGGSPLEVMVPRGEVAVLLNVLDEALGSAVEQPKAIVFDSVSSLIADAGFQACYRFLRQVNELLSRGDTTALFVVFSKAHDAKVMNVVKNLYSEHLTFDSGGLHVKKQK